MSRRPVAVCDEGHRAFVPGCLACEEGRAERTTPMETQEIPAPQPRRGREAGLSEAERRLVEETLAEGRRAVEARRRYMLSAQETVRQLREAGLTVRQIGEAMQRSQGWVVQIGYWPEQHPAED